MKVAFQDNSCLVKSQGAQNAFLSSSESIDTEDSPSDSCKEQEKAFHKSCTQKVTNDGFNDKE